jgi:hypothetical protein
LMSPGWQDRRGALVDGILTNLRGAPWPLSIFVNLTEDLRSTLTVDRRQVSPQAAEIKPVIQSIRQSGGAALAAWRNPDFPSIPKRYGNYTLKLLSLRTPSSARLKNGL